MHFSFKTFFVKKNKKTETATDKVKGFMFNLLIYLSILNCFLASYINRNML